MGCDKVPNIDAEEGARCDGINPAAAAQGITQQWEQAFWD